MYNKHRILFSIYHDIAKPFCYQFHTSFLKPIILANNVRRLVTYKDEMFSTLFFSRPNINNKHYIMIYILPFLIFQFCFTSLADENCDQEYKFFD